MGLYPNQDNDAFRQAVTEEIYIDKTDMIALMNQKLNKPRVKYVCVRRPRRFGKSTTADMLSAHYARGCCSRELFTCKKIEEADSFEIHLNQHNVIRLDSQRFLFDTSHPDIFIDKIQSAVIKDLESEYGGCFVGESHIYNPQTITELMDSDSFQSYWTGTETYEALKVYIDLNFDGLKEAAIGMPCNAHCHIDPSTCQNDMTTFKSRNDVLILLLHLGYLSFDEKRSEVFIPSQEIAALHGGGHRTD